jgi:hypothetical protein
MATRFSPEIPWVVVEVLAPGQCQALCEVCGEHVQGPRAEVVRFAGTHQAHTAGPEHLGLGDALAAVAKPVARRLGLEPACTPCEARRRAANALRIRRPW